MAQTLQGQIGQLLKIAAGQTDERGQHAQNLRSAASDTAGQLDRVVGRYEKTASALNAWVPELEYAQSQSLKALAAAQDAAARQRASQPVIRAAGQQETADEQQQDQARQNALDQANADLAAARQMLASATSYRDQKARETRAKIESAINDGLKDGFWSDIGDFFGRIGDWLKNNWVPLLKDICTVLEILAVILAIIALFATGAGLLLALAFIATALALAGRTLLAATGNGSWIEVALDAFSLLTLGIGGGIAAAGFRIAGIAGRAGATVDEAIQVGDRLVMAERAATFSGKTASFLGKMTGFINDSRLIPDGLAKPLTALGKIATGASARGRPLASTIVQAVDETTALERLFNTGVEQARYALKMNMIADRFLKSAEITALKGTFDTKIWQLRGVVFPGILGPTGGLAASGFPVYGTDGWHLQAYNWEWFDHLEESTTISAPEIVQRLDFTFTQVTGG